MPADLAAIRRFARIIFDSLPRSITNALITAEINAYLDHDMYSLTPNFSPFAQHILINDDIGNRIACGSVKIKTDVKRFTSNGVEFVDGTYEDNIDVVS